VFGEADYLPALIIDNIQRLFCNCRPWPYGDGPLGRQGHDVSALERPISTPRDIRNGMMCRCVSLEGLASSRRVFCRRHLTTQIIINENGLRLHVDIENGQEDGLFFWISMIIAGLLQHYSKGCGCAGRLLTYTGSFRERMLVFYGAKSVLGAGPFPESAVATGRVVMRS